MRHTCVNIVERVFVGISVCTRRRRSRRIKGTWGPNGYHHSLYNSHIPFPSRPLSLISRRDLPRAKENPPSNLLPFHERFLYLPPRPPLSPFGLPLPIDVYTSSRCPLFLIDDLNFWIYFGSRLRFVPTIRSRVLPPVRFPFGSLTLSRSTFHVIIYCAAADRETVIVFSVLGRTRKGVRAYERNDFEIFVARHKFGGGGLAYLNMDRTFRLSSSYLSSSSSSSFAASISFSSPSFSSTCSARAPSCCWLLPHRFSPSSFFLFFFSGPDLHCLQSANKLSRGHPVQIPIVVIIVPAREYEERIEQDSSRARALWSLKFSIGWQSVWSISVPFLPPVFYATTRADRDIDRKITIII